LRGPRLRSADEVRIALRMSVMAMVPRINPRLSSVARGQMVYLDARSPVAEAYRSIRTSLNLGSSSGARSVLIASPAAGDGKSTTASNLAIAFAQAGQRTLVIDCDLREPVQHLIFETDGTVGLTSVIAGEAPLRDAVRPTRVPGLYILPCGPVPSNPSELLAGKRFARLMSSLCARFDRIIIDSPPLTNVADGRVLAAGADATLLVLRMNHSNRRLGELALDGLQKVGAQVIGAIANDMPAGHGHHYYGGSWQYASHVKHLMLPNDGAANAASSIVQALPHASADANGNESGHRGGNRNGHSTSHGHSSGNGNGNGHGPSPTLPGQADDFRVEEPDWSADLPLVSNAASHQTV
ncbi:MAG TPA: CpsD/CapB family tyrosine-protein kinase, partial [Tepidisphaeraceae bacterium]|nr:CpsD/CapB family tyrosine-protein kinase [Tepidisphaeraceae bacterium]